MFPKFTSMECTYTIGGRTTAASTPSPTAAASAGTTTRRSGTSRGPTSVRRVRRPGTAVTARPRPCRRHAATAATTRGGRRGPGATAFVVVIIKWPIATAAGVASTASARPSIVDIVITIVGHYCCCRSGILSIIKLYLEVVCFVLEMRERYTACCCT